MSSVTLAGSPTEIGTTLGTLAGRSLRRRLEAQLGGQPEWADLFARHARRIAEYHDLLADVVPHWCTELETMAQAAEVPVEALLLVNCPPLRLLPERPGHNCTAFMAIGAASGCGHNLLHKNRDEQGIPQLAFMKHVDGCNRLLGGIEVGGVGVAQMVNEHGLAGANNTGSPVTTPLIEVGFDDCQVLRIVGERATRCDEALAVCRELVHAGRVRREGRQNGMIFLFADPVRGLVVELTSTDLWHEFHPEGLVCRSNHFLLPPAQRVVDSSAVDPPEKSSTLKRYARAEALLRPRAGRLHPEDFLAAGKDTADYPLSLCNANTISTMTHRLAVPPEQRLTWVYNGFPRVAPLVEWSHTQVSTPVALLDGSGWTARPDDWRP